MAPMTTTTLDDELAAIAALRKAGDHEGAHARAVVVAGEHPDDVRAVLAAGGTCDRLGFEHDAIGYYDRANELGIPDETRQDFTIWYGSTLRNVGRIEESVARLAEGTTVYTEDAAMRAFLALALHDAGHETLALATMLEAAIVAAARPEGFRGYERALATYQTELVAVAIGDEPMGD
jgi:predicted Zn-dependent protease